MGHNSCIQQPALLLKIPRRSVVLKLTRATMPFFLSGLFFSALLGTTILDCVKSHIIFMKSHENCMISCVIQDEGAQKSSKRRLPGASRGTLRCCSAQFGNHWCRSSAGFQNPVPPNTSVTTTAGPNRPTELFQGTLI